MIQIWKPIAFIVGIALILGLTVAWITSIIGVFYGLPFFSYILPSSTPLTILGVTNVLVVIGIPLIGLVLTVMRLFFKSHIKPRWRAGLWGFWFLNIVGLFFIATFTVKQFSNGREVMRDNSSNLTNADTLTLVMGENPFRDLWFYVGDDLQISDDQLVSSDVILDIERSESENFELEQKHYSRGRSSQEAFQLANDIDYQVNIMDSKLVLLPNFVVPMGKKWRNQKVFLTLRVPEGKSIKLDQKVNRITHHMALNESMEPPSWYYYEDIINATDGLVWTMEEDGLTCPAFVNAQTQKVDLKDFNKVRVEGKMKVNIRKGEHYQIELKNARRNADKIEIMKIGETLDVSVQPNCNCLHNVTLNITLPSLKSVDFESTDDVKIQGFKEPAMQISVEGRGDLKAYVDVDSLTLRQSGYHELDVRGIGKYLRASLDEHAELDAERFEVKSADIIARNRNRLKLSVTDTLRQQKSPGSRVSLEGEPVVVAEEL